MERTIIHYSEIGLKGRNRAFFESILLKNIKESTGGKVTKGCGRMVLEGKAKNLAYIPGIHDYSPCIETHPSLPEMKKILLNIAKKFKGKSFCIRARRADKAFPMNSLELNSLFGKLLADRYKMKVNLSEPEVIFYIEIAKQAYIYYEKIPGIGGLPVGSSGKLLCLMSGGIDSPVAAYMMMKRGCKVAFVHFHNYDILKDEKIPAIIKKMARFQGESRIYMVPFKEIQQEIIKKAPPQIRFIIYRRYMMKISDFFAAREKAKALVTGDNIGQVASQTLINMNCVWRATNNLVFSPLLGMNKEEIIDLAKKIDTYGLSIMPYSDCCTYMTSESPDISCNIREIEKYEKKLLKRITKKTIEKTETIKIKP